MNRFLKNVLFAFIIGLVILLQENYFYGGFRFDSIGGFWLEFGMSQLYSFILSFSNIGFFYILNRIKWKDKIWPIRLVFGGLGATIVTLTSLFFLRYFLEGYFQGLSLFDFFADEKWKDYSFELWFSLTVIVVVYAVYLYKKSQENKVTESQIVAKTETAKYESLKNQLDPHFLFNSLNVLTSLIEENPKKAEKFTTGLSKVYRYVLEQKDKNLIPLEEELKFAKSYMELLKMRFEEGVEYSLPQQISNSDYKIVPLSLQLLLENAVKHNRITSGNPLQIKIYEQDGYLIISNNYRPKVSIEKSTKVGLANIKQRYALITKKQVVKFSSEITTINKRN